MVRCFSCGGGGADAGLEDGQPELLLPDRQAAVSEDLLSRLSSVAVPTHRRGDWEEAAVNLWSLGGDEGGAAGSTAAAAGGGMQLERRWSSAELPPLTRIKSVRPSHDGKFHWTESRKALETAIAVEQLSSSNGGGATAAGSSSSYSLGGIPEESPFGAAADAAAAGAGWQAGEARLEGRLNNLKLENYVMEGDGNCQFRSVSFGLYGTQQHHLTVRQRAIAYMKAHRDDFEAFLGEDFDRYLREMARSGTWGDELTLRAICEAFGVVVNVVTSDEQNWFLRYLPQQTALKYEVFLTYIAPVHYNAIRRTRTSDLLRRSFGRQSSGIARALQRYERAQALPDNPAQLTAA